MGRSQFLLTPCSLRLPFPFLVPPRGTSAIPSDTLFAASALSLSRQPSRGTSAIPSDTLFAASALSRPKRVHFRAHQNQYNFQPFLYITKT